MADDHILEIHNGKISLEEIFGHIDKSLGIKKETEEPIEDNVELADKLPEER